MNTLTLTKGKTNAKGTFKFLAGLLSVNLIWVIYEMINYICYLSDQKFLTDSTRWSQIDIAGNIIYLFEHFAGFIGIFAFIIALIQIIKEKSSTKMLITSFLFQLISCSVLVLDSILTLNLTTYANAISYDQKIFSLFGNIILVITLFALLFYISKLATKNTAIVATVAMTIIDIIVILDLFIFNLNIALEYFFTLSFSTKLIYILISIATLIIVMYTEVKEKAK